MASLHDVIAFILECAAHGSGTGDGGFTDDFCRQIERQVQGRFPGERVYVAPSGRRNDPERAQRIVEAARRLPTSIVAERFGISRSYVHRVRKKE